MWLTISLLQGYILSSSIDGTIQLKSFLIGNPELRLALNEDLVVSTNAAAVRSASPGQNAVVIDDCNFHECVRGNDFEQSRQLQFLPPAGEFVLMNYRLSGERCRPPFRVYPFFELVSPFKAELVIKIRADLPDTIAANGVVVSALMPKSTSSVSFELPMSATGQTTDYDSKERQIFWRIKKFTGGSEISLRARV